jgi:hypothetical protein
MAFEEGDFDAQEPAKDGRKRRYKRNPSDCEAPHIFPMQGFLLIL